MEEWITSLASTFHDIHRDRKPYVCRKEIFALLNNCVNLLYPSRCEDLQVNPSDWSPFLSKRKDELVKILKELKIDEPLIHTQTFLKQLPHIKTLLDKDAAFFASQDPASESLDEVILCYPGFFALVVHRLAHELYEQDIPLLPRIMSEYAHEKTGIDIHPGAKLGNPIFIDHGTGIVIGETSRIGNNVKLFQGVTLGAPSVQRKLKGTQRHPIVGDGVIIYANATILGGDTFIGDHSIIGGNVWITESIPSNSRIYYTNHQNINEDP